ncbi:hypothetical protein MBN61_02780, partial [Candidatus Saccharibacteria bacterium]|nr:hypothetical protein [Candidatus Saccharibacteria bacterium]
MSKQTHSNTPSTMQRKQVAIRFFTYGVMAIATVVGVIVCIGWAMGFRFGGMLGLPPPVPRLHCYYVRT